MEACHEPPRRLRIDNTIEIRRPRHLAPMPPDRLAALPGLFVREAGVLLTPFPRRSAGLSAAERKVLEDMQERVAFEADMDRLPDVAWVWADRVPSPSAPS